MQFGIANIPYAKGDVCVSPQTAVEILRWCGLAAKERGYDDHEYIEARTKAGATRQLRLMYDDAFGPFVCLDTIANIVRL